MTDGASQTLFPNLALPAIWQDAVIIQFFPILTLCATCTKLSILVFLPMTVFSKVEITMQLLLPI